MTKRFDGSTGSNREFLTYEEGAQLLKCEHERLRDAPLEQLPRYQVGKTRLVYRPELIQYVLTHCRIEPRGGIEEFLTEIEDVILSPSDDGQRPSRRRAS